MKALVLTYDANRSLTDHMIYKYRQLWPDNPFTFHIPWQNDSGHGEAGRKYLKSPADIKGTVLTLLSDLDPEEWIYWCPDDKYPITLSLPGIRSVYAWVRGSGDPLVGGVLFCRTHKHRRKDRLTGTRLHGNDNIRYLERSSYDAIWIHQFLRVKVLKYLFQSFPETIAFAKEMDTLKDSIDKPADHRLFVVNRNMAVFGESASRGVLTQNCYRSMIDAGIALPEWHTGDLADTKIKGRMHGPLGRLLPDLFAS